MKMLRKISNKISPADKLTLLKELCQMTAQLLRIEASTLPHAQTAEVILRTSHLLGKCKSPTCE